MKVRKTYYSIGEVSKILNIKEHTLRFWDSQLQGLSKESDKGKTRFFTENNINKIAEINKLLNNNNALNLAYRIVSNNKSNTSKNSDYSFLLKNKYKIKEILSKLNKLLNNK